ncbi:Reh1p NDAI_0J02220 [Naumovozyma dairenensis CBS 421]|uniref:C2H2-type domain-containing protein n=1 Tax=Naumovozyma dairenensis (strain ATCC 10597 / BCRC 20456 / CBS 421 / NBRC 0211 / NRRL Y-12639) TaxID=1071378 RepID=G0WH36_NAUDC|nr:hypothetical protein NDAI_0J02220 [Naumovozyma dairenensis CBS 421]CCD27114.1 hypothetical protein NDAI_0J02220 [Naumovozyma dairenensis CBS 421]
MMDSPIFTCNSCLIQFKSSDLQRYHMKTEWHRYNLKRRVAQLPPVGSEEFAEKLHLSELEQHKVDEFGFAVLKPLPSHHERKTAPHRAHKISHIPMPDYDESGQKIAANAVRSNDLHKTISAAGSLMSDLSIGTEITNTDYGEDTVSEYAFTSDSNFEDATSEDELSELRSVEGFRRPKPTECIYCGIDSKEIERNVKHMFHKHGLYIPERSYLINLKSLLEFLIDTIVIDKRCLCCNFEGTSLSSIRDHMGAKRHCRMPYETREERELFAPYYDFSSLDESSENLTGKKESRKQIHFDATASEPEDDSVVEPAVNDINSNYTTVSVDESGLELTLPTGARLGHRSGQRYYRQNLPTTERREARNAVTAADKRMVSGVTEKQYKSGMKKMQQLEKRATNERIRKEVKRGNFQEHFRDELLQ